MDELFAQMPVPKAYFKLALPVVLSMVVNMAYNLIDTFFIAQTHQPAMVAAVTICTPLFSFMLAMGDMFGLGGAALISRYLGEGKRTTCTRISSFCTFGAVVLGALVTVGMFGLEHPLLRLLGATSATWDEARRFYQIMAVGAVIIIFSLVPTNLLRTEGLATEAMIGSVGGTIVTICCDPLFIFGFHMGAAGAAAATVLGYIVTDLLYLYYVIRRCQVITVDPRQLQITWQWVKEVIVIGIPASLTNLMQSLGLMILNECLVPYGTTKIAAAGIVMKIDMIVILILVGFAFGAQPLVGYNYGARNKKRFTAVVGFDLLVEVGYATIGTVALMVAAPFLIRLFMNDPVIIRTGTVMMRIFLSTTPFIGAVMVFTTVFQSAGKAGSAFIMAIARQGLFYVAALATLIPLIGYLGVLWAQPVADVLTGIVGGLLYWRVIRVFHRTE
ncbi:MATE family efflux transporter [Ligilactobacillus sp. LYQ60]|uniref:MATE family efflux transporter n=1 Tax=Ligilactobacillus sp. LYQ60 TaxID=3378799 RepID=UPI003852C739